MHEYSKISLRTLTIVLSTRGFADAPRFRALKTHWTAKCYELANKEAPTWDENRAITICPALPAGRIDHIADARVLRQPKARGAFFFISAHDGVQRMTAPARRIPSSI